jgi:hypothetical protein
LPPPLGFHHRSGFTFGRRDTRIPLALGFLIKHPFADSVSTAEHRDDDHKRNSAGASVITIFLSTWLHSGGDIPDSDLFCLDATALELLRIVADSVYTTVVRRFFPSALSIHAPLRIVEDLFDSP